MGLMKGLGAVSSSSGLALWWQQGEGAITVPVLSIGWVPLHQLA